VDAFPAAFPFGVSEKAAKNGSVEIAFAFEIAIEAAVGEAGAGHDLVERHTFKAVAIEELARAVDDGLLYGFAMAGGVRHEASLRLVEEVWLERRWLPIKILC
jgi:hypothetical protein